MDDPKPGIGGAPTRPTTLPTAAADRKAYPVASGLLDYFPDALVAVAHVSYVGNEQHNSGQPLHWARGKSSDEADTMLRHFMQRGSVDTDGIRHSAKMAWRALALLQKEIEAEVSVGTVGPIEPAGGVGTEPGYRVAAPVNQRPEPAPRSAGDAERLTPRDRARANVDAWSQTID